MSFVAADWTVDRQTGNIRYIGDDHGGASPSYATVIELHRALQDLADDASSSGDDELDITDPTPTDRSTDNIITLNSPYNIDATASEHLYDGSIIQNGGDDIYDGIVNYGNATQIQIIQNGAVLSDDWWNSNGGLNANATSGISHLFMLPVRASGADIDNRRIIGTTRRFGYTYSEFVINSTSRGNNVLALSEATDLNNQTASGTVAAWSISNTSEGYTGIDVNGDSTSEYYYSAWDKDAQSINDLYEYTKYLTRDGSASTLYGLSGELFRGITHEITVDTPTGTFTEPELVTWTGGTGQLLAINSTTAATKMWIQLLTGVAPTNNQTITGDSSSATVDVDTTVTTRTISAPFIGTSTGSAIIGAYGVGIEAADLSASDKVFDLTNTQITPPNNVTFTVSGIVSGDRVLVTNDSSGDVDYSQLALDTTLSGATESSVVVTTTIPTDTPSSGTIRIQRDDGTYTRHAYDSYASDTFTLSSATDFSTNNATAGNNVFISYIDVATSSTSESFTSVYSSDRTLFVRVRNAGGTPIKTFETTGTLGSSGGSATAIRTSDA